MMLNPALLLPIQMAAPKESSEFTSPMQSYFPLPKNMSRLL